MSSVEPNFKFCVKADPCWAPFTGLMYKESGLLLSACKVDLPSSLRITESVKQCR